MARCTIPSFDAHRPDLGAFVRERIPAEHRSCWSIARSRRTTGIDWWTRVDVYDFTFWFARRYAWVGFEMKLRFG